MGQRPVCPQVCNPPPNMQTLQLRHDERVDEVAEGICLVGQCRVVAPLPVDNVLVLIGACTKKIKDEENETQAAGR